MTQLRVLVLAAFCLIANIFPAWVHADTSVAIHNLLKEGRHPRLRWGNFSDVKTALIELYGPVPALTWVSEGKPTAQAKKVLESLSEADDKGLNASDYDVDRLKKWCETTNPGSSDEDMAAFDVALSVSVMRYVSNLYLGRINPRTVGFGLNIEPKKLDLTKRVGELSHSARVRELIDEMEPQFPVYRPLRDALVRYRRLAGEIPHLRFNFPVKFTPGMNHKDVPALRKLLVALGDLKEIEPGQENSENYSPELAAAVKAFQIRHGLGNDGVIGRATLAQLSMPISQRLKQIQLGLERMRWLPADVRGLYLLVNIPSFKLYGSRGGGGLGQYDIEMNVVVGEAMDGRSTPVFHSDMTYVYFRPYWNVPEAIATKELIPDALRSPGYLSRNNFEIIDSSTPGPALEASASNLDGVAKGRYRLRQKPGPKNALGLVKFAFPNTNNVYLHSTPSVDLFNRARRDFSHGCVRVQDPAKLAEWVLADEGDWSRERIEAAMNDEPGSKVSLKKPIPVYIFYSTVMSDLNGNISFYDDIYGHDRTLQVMLARGFPYPR